MERTREQDGILSDFNDELRTLLLNQLYYDGRKKHWSRIVTAYNAVVAVGMSSSVAGLAVFQLPTGRVVFSIIAVLCTVLAVIRCVLGLEGRLSDCTYLYSTYATLYFQAKDTHTELRGGRLAFDRLSEKREDFVRWRHTMAAKESVPSEKTVRKLQDRVKERLPVSYLWWDC